MRQIDPDVLRDRKNRILQAVIHHFIKTGKPVGSSVLTDDYGFDLSTATIRNLMAELEEDGFLTHPHTSAGRMPTDKGYRTYVDSIMDLQRLAIEEEERIRVEYEGRKRELEDMLVQTSKILSGLSKYSGFVVAPRNEKNLLKYLELIKVEDGVLAILVTHNGMVKHKMIQADISREKLNELTKILNDKLKGLTLSEVKKRIMPEIREYEKQERTVLTLGQLLSREIFDADDELYIEGTSNVLTLPEFKDYEPMRSILRLNDDKDILLKLVHDDYDDEGIRVTIGSETSIQEFKDLSVVSTVYKDGEVPVGILGIIGPKRMEYGKMMSLVSAVSQIVNKVLTRKGG